MLDMDHRVMDGIISLISLIYSGLSVYLLKK
nr:MAG TPA: Chloramphenicol acetyltransferase [Caudoviricetes sp.]